MQIIINKLKRNNKPNKEYHDGFAIETRDFYDLVTFIIV